MCSNSSSLLCTAWTRSCKAKNNQQHSSKYSLEKLLELTYLAFLVINYVSNDDSGLRRKVLCHLFQGFFVPTNHEDVGTFVEIEVTECLTNATRSSSNQNPFFEEVIWQFVLFFILSNVVSLVGLLALKLLLIKEASRLRRLIRIVHAVH
jgi:hypothetical protein